MKSFKLQVYNVFLSRPTRLALCYRTTYHNNNNNNNTGIFLGTSQLAYSCRRQKLGRSPSAARGVGGHAPPGNFEKSDAIICIFVYFEGHKIAT